MQCSDREHSSGQGASFPAMAASMAMAATALFLITVAMIGNGAAAQKLLAITPPRGWNSYDSFSWIVSEEEFLANAALVASKLQESGYEYVVVDFLWFRKNTKGASVVTPGFDLIDEWGRPVPDPQRWPSTANGRGFAPIADKVHALGLKFGIHVMRGISTAAVQQNTPVLGANGWKAKDIALTSQPCSWMKDCFVSVNTSSDGGMAFINSLYQQYASWGVDFIKHDCVFGEDDLSLDEIRAVSEAIATTNRPIIYSLSPGVRATPAMGKSVANLVHMYRVTSDDWDTWGDLQLHFDTAKMFAGAGLIGSPGLGGGRSWPDLDMLPLGWLTDPGARRGPHRYTNLTPDEQRLQMTLWALTKSPLIYGGDLRRLDDSTRALITNPVMLDINSHSLLSSEISATADPGNEADPVLRLVGCNRIAKTQWKLTDDNKMCWSVPKYTNASNQRVTGCMNWQADPTDKTIRYTGHASQWSLNLGEHACLDAHGRMPGKYKGFISSKMQPCSRRQSQRWELTPEGSLRNEKTGLCAEIHPQVYVSRVWSARGSDGEYYLALFNLGNSASTITVSVQSVVSHDKSSSSWQCDAMDVWNNKAIGVVSNAVAAQVSAHGCALFTLTCSLST